jgi:hypothetical protein
MHTVAFSFDVAKVIDRILKHEDAQTHKDVKVKLRDARSAAMIREGKAKLAKRLQHMLG